MVNCVGSNNRTFHDNKLENFNYVNVATSLPCGTECFIQRPRLQPTIKKNNRLELAESVFRHVP